MPAIELPGSASAIIATRSEITERTSRSISRAYMVAGATVARLIELGYNENDPTTWSAYAKLSPDEQNAVDGYEAALIVGMVKSWSLGDLPTADSVYDLPSETFKALATACADEYNRSEEFSPDGVTDPKAPTAD
jgi:hypothetical protein